MNHIERRNAGLPYITDEAVMDQQVQCRKILQRLNTINRWEFDEITAILSKLFGTSDNPFVNPPSTVTMAATSMWVKAFLPTTTAVLSMWPELP